MDSSKHVIFREFTNDITKREDHAIPDQAEMTEVDFEVEHILFSNCYIIENNYTSIK